MKKLYSQDYQHRMFHKVHSKIQIILQNYHELMTLVAGVTALISRMIAGCYSLDLDKIVRYL
jgi:hypothetical protein